MKKIAPEELSDNPIRLIGRDWMLITAGQMGDFNTMTASWGGVGHWISSVCFVTEETIQQNPVRKNTSTGTCLMKSYLMMLCRSL